MIPSASSNELFQVAVRSPSADRNTQAKVAGAMTVYFDGALRTMQQMGRYAEEPDRRLRQFAWEATTTRRLVHEAEFDDLLDKRQPCFLRASQQLRRDRFEPRRRRPVGPNQRPHRHEIDHAAEQLFRAEY